jgi:beta-galactosidase
MSIRRSVVLILLLFYTGLLETVQAQKRQHQLFNAAWKFNKGDVGDGEKFALNDAAWRTVDLPHDWSIEGPFSDEWASGTGYLPGGKGWYRKTFALPAEQRTKNVYLYFDGVYKNSEVWINEHYLGKRPNGYASFYYDITAYLRPKGNNLIAVKVDHTDFADSRWYTGSGINRNVYMIAVGPVHIAPWGISFTTPEVSGEKAVAQVKAMLKNNTAKNADVRVVTELTDAEGKNVAKAEQTAQVPARKEIEVSLSFNVSKPQVWSTEHPALYHLRNTVYVDGKQVDDVTTSVGFRSFHFDADKGFFLNGKNIKLKGVCVHDDAGALGSAVPEDVWRRRLTTLKEMGCNSIRMSHNPHQDYLYDLCDQLGLLVQDEAFDEWEAGKNKWIKGWNVGTPGKDGYNKDFSVWAERDLRDMILRSRNHPSVIMWSIGNEIDYPNDPYTHEVLNTGRNPQIYGKGYQPGYPAASRLGEIAKQLVKVVKQTDPTRPVTAALAGVVMSNFTDYPGVLDLVGYNYQEYRYAEDHQQYPTRVIYGSENGKGYDAWIAVDTTRYIAAQYLWTGIDFVGEARSWPVRSSDAGLLDMAGFPKPEYFYRKSLWTTEPVMYIGASIKTDRPGRRGYRAEPHWNWTAGDSLRVTGFTNAEEAELFLNGKSLGRKRLAESGQKVLSWELLYQPGELSVKGYAKGAEVSSAILRTASAPVAISATIDRSSLPADKNAVAHVTIQVVDENGLPVYAAENELEIKIEGPGRLIGLESGSLSSHEDYKSNKRKAVRGKLIAYVQAVAAGEIKVIVQSPGLKAGTIIIQGK